MRWIVLGMSLLFAMPSSASEVYYCSDNVVTGIEPENAKTSVYKPARFKVGIDWASKTISSEYLIIEPYDHCMLSPYQKGSTIYCMNFMGGVFSINRETLKYNRATTVNMYNEGRADQDSVVIGIGSCEKF